MNNNQDKILKSARSVLKKEALAIRALGESLDQDFIRAVNLILESKGRIVIIGVGKSGHVGQKIAASLASLGTPAFFVHGIEAVHGDLGMIQPGDVLILLSYSGETAEMLNLLPHLARRSCSSIAITGNANSTMAKAATVHLDIGVRSEADTRGLAPTSSSTATMALGDALAVVLADAYGFTPEDFRRFHPGGSLGKRLSEGFDHKE